MLRSRSCGRPEPVEQPGAGEREDGEADDEAGDDRERAARRPPLAPPASTIGSTGSTHGETAVIEPATKAIPSRTSTHVSVVGAVRGWTPGVTASAARRAASPAPAASGVAGCPAPFCGCCCSGLLRLCWPCGLAPSSCAGAAGAASGRSAAFGAGRFSASACATSGIVPSRSRAASISWFARGV